ncbi:Actin-related protein 2/3 complex subunit 3-A, partial [Fragariocoptes setiger]
MPAYHSKLANVGKSIGNMAFLTFKTKFRGPVMMCDESHLVDGEMDIIDEAFYYFKPNVFFKTYEIQSDADRVIIYLTLYITECLKRLQKTTSRDQAIQEMYSLSISRFDIPGDPSFPLNSMYAKPSNQEQAELLKSYLTQLRQECGLRLVDKVYNEPGCTKPSKWWTCMVRRKFMDMSLK